MTVRRLGVTAMLLALALSAGCGGLGVEPDAAEKNYYVLEADRTAERKEPATDAALAVAPFSVSPAYDTTQFIYRTGSASGRQDYYNRFFAPPGRLVSTAAREWLSEAGVFAHVLGGSSGADCRFRLEGHVSALYGDYSSDGKPKAVLAVQFFLLDRRSTGPGITLSKTYRRAKKLSGDGPATLVGGWNAALEEILKELEGDLQKAVAR